MIITFHLYTPATDVYCDVSFPADKPLYAVADMLVAITKDAVVQGITYSEKTC